MTTLNDREKKINPVICLLVFALAYAAPNYAQYQISPLGPQIIQRFGLSDTQFQSFFTAPMLPAIFLGFISGMLVDRLGYKPVLAVSMILTAVGAWLRYLSSGYGMMYAAMVMMGFSAAFISANGAKILSNFFKPEKISVVMGLVLTITTTGYGHNHLPGHQPGLPAGCLPGHSGAGAVADGDAQCPSREEGNGG